MKNVLHSRTFYERKDNMYQHFSIEKVDITKIKGGIKVINLEFGWLESESSERPRSGLPIYNAHLRYHRNDMSDLRLWFIHKGDENVSKEFAYEDAEDIIEEVRNYLEESKMKVFTIDRFKVDTLETDELGNKEATIKLWIEDKKIYMNVRQTKGAAWTFEGISGHFNEVTAKKIFHESIKLVKEDLDNAYSIA